MLGKLFIEGYRIIFDDYLALNEEPETKRLGLIYPDGGDIKISIEGNTSAILIIKEELEKHLYSGTITIKHIFNNESEQKDYIICSN